MIRCEAHNVSDRYMNPDKPDNHLLTSLVGFRYSILLQSHFLLSAMEVGSHTEQTQTHPRKM